MKKSLIFTLACAGLLLTGCIAGDYGIKPADPQRYDQEPAMVFPGKIAVTAPELLDIATLPEGLCQFAQVTLPELPAGQELSHYRMCAQGKTLELTSDFRIDRDVLNSFIKELFGSKPLQYDLENVTVCADVVIDGQAALVTSDPFLLRVQPKSNFVSSAYYLIGDICKWDASAMLKFEHSDADVYEDPVFTLTFTAEADNQYWKIIPQENVDAGDVWIKGEKGQVGVEVDGSPALSGNLVTKRAASDEPGAGVIEKKGIYKMTINMEDYTYTISPMDCWTLIGQIEGSNWDQDFDMVEVAHGVWVSNPVNIEGEFKIRYNYGWDINRGAASTANPYPLEEGLPVVACNNGSNLTAPQSGTYTVCYNSAANMISLLDWGVVGSIGKSGWNYDVPMYLADGKWYSVPFEVKEGEEFKIREHATWGGDKGGTFTEVNVPVTPGGSNISAPAGTYMVIYDPVTEDIIVSNEFWGIVGDYNAWGGTPDAFLVPVGGNCWKACSVALSGGWKIRQGMAWNIDRGGVFGALDTPFDVTQGGPNIDCGEGVFSIVYDGSAETITVSEN